MESTIVKAIDTLLSQPPETLIDKDDWIVNGIVKTLHSFSKISQIAAAHRHKNYTDAKKEDIATELTKILFHCGCLTHLLDVGPDVFDIETLTEFSLQFPIDFQEDVILCSLQGIRKITDIAEIRYVDSSEDVFEEESSENGISFSGETDSVTLLKEIPAAGGSDDFGEDSEEQCLAEIFACVIVICDLVELDLETVMSNVGTITKP